MTRPADFVFTGSVTGVPKLEPVDEGVMFSREVFPNGVKTSDVPWTFEITLAPSGGKMTKKTKYIDLEISWLDESEQVVYTTTTTTSDDGGKLRIRNTPEVTGIVARNSYGVLIPIPPEQREAMLKTYRDNISWVQIIVKGIRKKVTE